MKAILFLLFLVAFAWCCFGCSIGGDPDPNNGSDVTIPDSVAVKDTVIDDIKKRKVGTDTVAVLMLIDDNTTVVRKVIGWKVSDSVYLNYEKTKRIDFNKVIVAKVKQ